MRLPPPWLVAALLGAGLLLLSGGSGAPSMTQVDAGLEFGVRVKPIEAIVVHHTDTACPAATQRVLRERGFSTNYEVDQAGRIYCYGDPASCEAQASGSGANAHTLAIDLTHIAGPFPAAQVAAMRKLCHYLAARFGFVLALAPVGVVQEWQEWSGSGYTLLRHNNLHATACPGGAPMADFV